jgi:hypothetical protein
MTSPAFRFINLCVLSAALLVQCAGCAVEPATCSLHLAPLESASSSVSELVVGTHGGTAVYLGDGRWITCRHVLEGASTVSIDGSPKVIRVLRSGEASRATHKEFVRALADWITFEIPEAGGRSAKKPARYDSDLPVASGQEVYLIGYARLPGAIDRSLSVVRARVVRRPWWLPKGPLYLAGPSFDLAGLSGGAAVVTQGGKALMIGLYQGSFKTGLTGRVLLVILRPPE